MNKSKDYTIFKIRYYADGINVRKGIFSNDDDKEQRQQHWDRAQEYTRFFWEMFEKSTGKSHKQYCMKYFLSSRECAIEELWADYDVLIPEAEEHYYWFIPKHMTELTEWIKDNCKLPFKVVRRSEYSSCLNNQKTTWRREDAEEFTKKNLANLNIPNE